MRCCGAECLLPQAAERPHSCICDIRQLAALKSPANQTSSREAKQACSDLTGAKPSLSERLISASSSAAPLSRSGFLSSFTGDYIVRKVTVYPTLKEQYFTREARRRTDCR